jgi:hypothetical protein
VDGRERCRNCNCRRERSIDDDGYEFRAERAAASMNMITRDVARLPVPAILTQGFRPFFLAAGLWSAMALALSTGSAGGAAASGLWARRRRRWFRNGRTTVDELIGDKVERPAPIAEVVSVGTSCCDGRALR